MHPYLSTPRQILETLLDMAQATDRPTGTQRTQLFDNKRNVLPYEFLQRQPCFLYTLKSVHLFCFLLLSDQVDNLFLGRFPGFPNAHAS